jgi:glycerol-3-phosphate acyltransferase PlsX
MLTIAVDAMGGDIGVEATLPACAKFLENNKDVNIILVGDENKIKQHKVCHNFSSNISIIHADEVISMDDNIETALRKKRKSSMRLSIEQVKNNNANVCVSSGNTGALMALSHYLLKTITGIDRPAIATFLPNQKQTGTAVLDLGANADCSAYNLLQFAHMANIMVKAINNIDSPTIGLLNIGEEVIKGNDIVKQAGQLLRESELNFYGNVEGNDIFKGTTDIVVCDGFVGNVALKAAEGVAKMISSSIKQSFSKNIFTKLSALLSYSILKQIKTSVDHRRYNGAMLLGLNGLVVKSHGSADKIAFYYALEYAYRASKYNMIEHMQKIFNI